MVLKAHMTVLEAKLGYISGQHRVKLELTRKICLKKNEPDIDLFNRAAIKLDSVLNLGLIASYEVYKENVNKVWKKLRDDATIPEDLIISMTLAQGAPKLAGLEFSVSANPKAAIDLTISAHPREVAKWYHGWVTYALNKEVQKSGKHEFVNPSQVKGAMMRAITGQAITGLPISGIYGEHAASTPADSDKTYSIVANRSRQEISFLIRDVKNFLSKIGEAGIIKIVHAAAAKMKEQNGDIYKVLEEEITANVKSLAGSPELLGFDLPVIILGAIGVKTAGVATLPDIAPVAITSRGPGLELKITANKLIACIANFSMDFYDDPNLTFDRAWFKQQLKYLKIPEKSYAPHIENLIHSASKKVDLTGMFVAQGQPPVSGARPYLYETYLDRTPNPGEMESDNLDIRGIQQRSLVATGDVIAEIKYHVEPQVGSDVFGEVIQPAATTELEIQTGEGVIRKPGGKFVAGFEGAPTIEKNCVSMSKMLIHKGDVNLRTGNIVFDGPIEIRGSIDTGASVVSTSDVSVFGSIRGGKIRAGGSIAITEGVVTGLTGTLEAKGSISADFIENSNVHCGGTLTVKKSILNCQIITGENIEITNKEDGILAGGSVSCKQYIVAANIGFKRGALTVLRVGVDWRIERTVKIKSNRLTKVTDCQDRDRLELRELVSKTRAQLTKKHDEKKKNLQSRLVQARVIMTKLQQQLDDYRAKLSFNMKSAVVIGGTLYNNVEIHIGGAKISVPNDLAGVAIIAKKRRGSHIVPVEEVLKALREDREAG
jgi:uncharacterized protein (DUF342 family)